MADKTTTLLPFVRKHKPRALPVGGTTPSHPVLRVPRAIVQHGESVHREVQHSSPAQNSSRRISLESSLFSIDRGSSPQSLSVQPSSLHGIPPSAQISKPRKRFRKKVNGLFGDQTELKKRMSRLIRDSASNIDEQSHAADGGLSDIDEGSGDLLPAAKSIIDHLAATGQSFKSGSEATEESIAISDSFDFVELTETACKAVGSPEKLAVLRQTMGTLSPRRNDRFIEELKLGKSSLLPRYIEEAHTGDVIAPPLRPVPNGDLLRRDDEKLGDVNLSPVSIDRTGAPAVLRSRARRLDRGYRCVDVLRARRHSYTSTESSAVFAPTKSSGSTVDSGSAMTSPIVRRSREQELKDEKSSVDHKQETPRIRNRFDFEKGIGLESIDENRRRKRPRRSDETVREYMDEDRSMSKYTNGSSNVSVDGRGVGSDDGDDEEEDRDEAHNPLKMLVEAATGRSESHLRNNTGNIASRGVKARKRMRRDDEDGGKGLGCYKQVLGLECDGGDWRKSRGESSTGMKSHKRRLEMEAGVDEDLKKRQKR